MLLLNREDITRCVELPKLVRALEDAHRGFARSAPVVPQRSIITHERQKAFSLFMPAYLPGNQTLGVKVSSFHPGNVMHGLSTVNGAVLLIDVETGRLLAMLDSGLLTALRTSAMSALATDKLCPQRRIRLAVVGAGVQAEAHIKAMAAIREVGQVKIFSRRPAHSAALAERLSIELMLPIEATHSMQEALFDADVVCTTTSHESPQPLIKAHQLNPRAHINAIGGSTVHACEIDPRLLGNAQVYVDHLRAACRESGEITQALAWSVIDVKDIREIGDLVIDQPSPVMHKDGLSYFRSVGHASQDMVVAACIYYMARAEQIGKQCDYLST
ncbi:ornithine cyclodeaminase family protein [Pseudomonas sp. SORT22]|uniref:ornithine cyclodeaminase family protein n=1 Tax=Pseudomonas sp. SORT22 TaxID=2813842 RepID=UPI001BD00F04|nr:ornithine cyclodeaminase family protein [Pseudomonas sp. SORT22]QVM94949.1 ornithine cyclodeaminase family protein [Pseudomonas sp. SORT22]